jgi:glycosyltransferase involved in cell wall biosynthesis
MGDELSVSVVVPVWNGALTTGDTLTALLNQASTPRDIEIIVVDNGSTDCTTEIVARYDVTLLTERKRGASAARNRGLEHARGNIVVFLDADTLPTRRWLAELIAPFADSNAMLAGGRILDYPPRTPPERFMAQMGTFKLEYTFFRQDFPYLSSCNLAVRRTAALAISGWDETLSTAEDLDFCLRLVRRFSCPLLRQPNAIVLNRHRSTDESLRRQAWGYGVGLGKAHRRYPEIIRLNFARWSYLGLTLGVRWSQAMFLSLGQRLGLTSAGRAEFARYHWFWSRWYWRGFFSALRDKEQPAV